MGMSSVPFPRSDAPGLRPRGLLPLALILSLSTVWLLPHFAEAVLGSVSPDRGEIAGYRVESVCRVVEIVDGDTVTLACAGRRSERARLSGFDTPELFSPGCAHERLAASRAKRHLAAMVAGAGRFDVQRHGYDRYGRLLAELAIDGRSVAQEMIAQGLARPYAGGRRATWCPDGGGTVPRHATAANWVRLD